MHMKGNLQIFCVTAVLVAGSCAGPSGDTRDALVFADGAANHPISVAPSYRSLKLSVQGDLGLEDRARLETFVADYLAHGNGALSVSAPRGSDSSRALDMVAETAVKFGVSRSRILVGTKDDALGDGRIEVGFVAYLARTDACGNWSQDADDTALNLPMPDFGCSVQHNVAAMVADPRDLVTPRDMAPADAARRTGVVKGYETGAATSATKTTAQSGAVSSVGTTGP